MAFSTQKDFLHVAYMNEHPEPRCLRMEGVKLRTYAGTFDERAWSMNKDKQAQYLIDLVSCRMYTSDGEDYGATSGGRSGRPGSSSTKPVCGKKLPTCGPSTSRSPFAMETQKLSGSGERGLGGEYESGGEHESSGERELHGQPELSDHGQHERSGHDQHEPSGHGQHESSGQRELSGQRECRTGVDGLTPTIGGDSVIVAALNEMSRFESLIAEKDDLKNQLEVSKEKLRILSEERDTINNILNDTSFPKMSCAFQCKIDDLKCMSKIDKNDENELLKILDGLYEQEKSFQVLEAQNNYLRILVDKLSSGSVNAANLQNADDIPAETSTDVNYLQCEVDCLRRQVACLSASQGGCDVEKVSRGTEMQGDKDAETIARIIAERNALRDKVQNFAAIECKIVQWKRDSERYQCVREEFCSAMKKKDEELQDCCEEIEELRFQLKKINKCVRQREQTEGSLTSSLDCLKDENRRLREDLCMANFELQKIQNLENQVQSLTDELCEKNCVIEQYDAQFQQLLGVVEGLQSGGSPDIVCLQDKHSQTQIEELAATTRATLDHISRELQSQHSLEAELMANKIELECARRSSLDAETKLEEKASENLKLKESLQKTTSAIRESLSELNVDPKTVASVGPESLKSILSSASKDMKKSMSESENRALELQNQNDELSKALAECQKKTAQLEKDLAASKSEMNEVSKVVKNIDDVKTRNDKLETVLDAVDYKSQYEKSQKDLEALEEQLQKCKQENEQLKQKINIVPSVPSVPVSEVSPPGPTENEQLKQKLASGSELATAPGSDALAKDASDAKRPEKKSSAKIAQLQKIHEAQRSKYEKEIDGHRLSNDVLQKSLTKLTTKMTNASASEFERKFREILDNFTEEICIWRCQKYCKKLSKVQEIGKKIMELGINCLTYKELVYLHQQVSEAGERLRPQSRPAKCGSSDLTCCKCSGNICAVPMLPRENEKILLEKLAILEQEINSARECLRKLKQQQSSCSVDTEPMECETLRARSCRQNYESKATSSTRSRAFIVGLRDECEFPTKDRNGCL